MGFRAGKVPAIGERAGTLGGLRLRGHLSFSFPLVLPRRHRLNLLPRGKLCQGKPWSLLLASVTRVWGQGR